MADIDQNFIDEYKKLLIFQYRGKTNAESEIQARLEPISRTFSVLSSFFEEFDIDAAYGDRLDKIGKIVGISRIVIENTEVTKSFFGWIEDNENAATFGDGPLFDFFKDSGYTIKQLSDYQMRFFIRAKVVKNTVIPYMSSEKNVNNIQDAYLFLFKSKGYVVDNKNMTLSIYVDETFNPDDINLLKSFGLLPAPMGVGVNIFIQYTDGATFGFSENPQSKTFGNGKFAELIGL